MSMKCAENIPQIAADGSEIGASWAEKSSPTHAWCISHLVLDAHLGYAPKWSLVGLTGPWRTWWSGQMHIVHMKWLLTRCSGCDGKSELDSQMDVSPSRWMCKVCKCTCRRRLLHLSLCCNIAFSPISAFALQIKGTLPHFRSPY